MERTAGGTGATVAPGVRGKGEMRFTALDSWRGIAAISVMFFHLSFNGFFYFFPPVRHAGLSVSFFFVLSGFVMTHAYGHRLGTGTEARQFVIRRFGRLYPLHLATLAVLVLLELAKLFLISRGISAGQGAFEGSNDLTTLVANIFLLQAVIPFPDYSWNGPSWSISVEFYTYLLFCAVMLLCRRATVLAALLVAVASAVSLLMLEHIFGSLHETQGMGLLTCIMGFFVGHIAYHLHTRRARTPLRNATLCELGCIGVTMMIYWFDPFPMPVTILWFAIVILVFAHSAGAVSRVLERPLFTRLGELSYSIYMLHYVLIAILSGVMRAAQSVLHIPLYQEVGDELLLGFGPPGTMDVVALLFAVTVIIVSVLSYRFIEMPGQRWFNRFAKPRQAMPIGQPEPSAP